MSPAPARLPRLLAGLDPGGAPLTLADHRRVHGPFPRLSRGQLTDAIHHSGLRGRGGADFPTAIKLRSVAGGGRGAALVVNGSETEPASAKDQVLIARLPHLVLDGAVLAAGEIGAREIIVRLGERASAVARALDAAIAVRDDGRVRIRVVTGPDGYVTGEESAIIHALNGGPAAPTLVPPRPYERGYRGRPTLVQNPETLAQIALVGRYGPRWYRELGTAADPGSALVTISGAVAAPGVYELAFGTSLRDLLAAAGGPLEPLRALLIGGYFGTWVAAEDALTIRLSREDLRQVGSSLGAGVLIALGESSCGLHESARVIDYLAAQSAGQCGPCVHGLRAIADALGALADGAGDDHLLRVRRWCEDVRGRGACHHPDGAVRFVRSAIGVFADELAEHRTTRCTAAPAGLPFAEPLASVT